MSYLSEYLEANQHEYCDRLSAKKLIYSMTHRHNLCTVKMASTVYKVIADDTPFTNLKA
jgi:hypothetical protein